MEKITKEMLWRWLKKGVWMNIAITIIGLVAKKFLDTMGLMDAPESWELTLILGSIIIVSASLVVVTLTGYILEKIEEKIKR